MRRSPESPLNLSKQRAPPNAPVSAPTPVTQPWSPGLGRISPEGPGRPKCSPGTQRNRSRGAFRSPSRHSPKSYPASSPTNSSGGCMPAVALLSPGEHGPLVSHPPLPPPHHHLHHHPGLHQSVAAAQPYINAVSSAATHSFLMPPHLFEKVRSDINILYNN